MESVKEHRRFLKNLSWNEWEEAESDEQKGVSPPSLQQPYPQDSVLIDLSSPDDITLGEMPLLEILRRRRSHREFTDTSLTLEELAFLLWATQGVHRVSKDGVSTRRTVPSGGGRHPFETYLIVKRVAGLERGLYRYLALEHKLCFLATADELRARTADNTWLGDDEAVFFIWAAVPYRSEWRYGIRSHKMIVMEAGHICQNLYLACEAICGGACAIGAFQQKELDALIGVDGEQQFAVYLARAGKV
jgi:SagB-type dehydrogenase family enzyme